MGTQSRDRPRLDRRIPRRVVVDLHRPRRRDATRLDVDFGYRLPGGIAGRTLGMLIEPIVGTAIRQTEHALRTRLGQLV